MYYEIIVRFLVEICVLRFRMLLKVEAVLVIPESFTSDRMKTETFFNSCRSK